MQAEWIVVAGARWPVAAAGSSCPVLDVRSEADRRLGALSIPEAFWRGGCC